MQTWTPEQTANFLRDTPPDNLQLLDVREPWEYEVVSIKGFVLIPLSQLQQEMDRLDQDKPVAVLCHHGVRSAHACYFLEKSGFDTINISGGIDLWARTLNPEMALY